MRNAALMVALIVLGGCAELDARPSLWASFRGPVIGDGESRAGNDVGAVRAPPFTPEKAFPRSGARRVDVGADVRRSQVRFDGAPLDEVVRAVITELLGVDIVVQPGEYPVVTFIIEKEVGRDELVHRLQATAIQNKARLFYADGVYQLTNDVPPNANQRVIRLKHRMPREFQAFGTGEGPVRVVPDDASRTLVLTGEPAAVNAVAETIMDLDVPAFDGVVFRWIDVREARQIANVLDRVGPLSVQQMPFGAGLLVWGPQADVRRVESLIGMLSEHGEATAYVYETHSINPAVCAELAGAGGRDGSGSAGLRGSVPPSQPGTVPSGGTVPFVEPGAGSVGFSAQAVNPRPTRLNVTVLEGRCVLRGARADVMELLEVLRMVDRPAVRVELQGALFEVRLTDELRYGVRAFLERMNEGAGYPVLARSSDVGSITDVLAKVPGGVAILPFSSWRVAVDALRGRTAVNVLAEPSADVDAGQEVRLQVGDQVPVVTQTAESADTGRITSQVSYRDVGVILKIKPVVRAGGMLQLTVNMEVSDALRTTVSSVDSPTIQRRGIDTTVTVLNGQTVLLGGLRRESGQDGKNGLPIVSDIPVLGALFSQTTQSRERQELALMITPRMVDDVAISARAREVMGRMMELRQGWGAPLTGRVGG